MFADRLIQILDELGLSNTEFNALLEETIDIDSIRSGKEDLSSKDMSIAVKGLNISNDLLVDPSIPVPALEMTIGDPSLASRTRAMIFVFNFRRIFDALQMQIMSFEKVHIHKEDDIISLVREIIQSKKSFREYLETHGIYVIELDRSKDFDGGIYSCGNTQFIILNKDHTDENKFKMLIELAANCLLCFDPELTDEQTDDLSILFCEEILKYLPCEKTFSIFAQLVARAEYRNIISSDKAAIYMLDPKKYDRKK